MSVKITYFVHGTTYDNASEKCSGWKQVELNDLGKEQAKKLGEVTKDLKFDVIFTSDYNQANKFKISDAHYITTYLKEGTTLKYIY